MTTNLAAFLEARYNETAKRVARLNLPQRRFALADLAAKRQIVALYRIWNEPETRGPNKGLLRQDSYALGVRRELYTVLIQLAQPYRDHEHFDPAWRTP